MTLIGVLSIQNKNAVLAGFAPRRSDIQVPAIPRKSRVRRMTLIAPGRVGPDRFPPRVVKGWLSPSRIVAQVKLPCTIDRHNTFADVGNDENRRMAKLRGCRVLLAGRLSRGEGSGKQKHQFYGVAGDHEARITPATTPEEQESA